MQNFMSSCSSYTHLQQHWGMPQRIACWLLLALLGSFNNAALASEQSTGIWAGAVVAGNFPSSKGDSRWLYAVEAQGRYWDLNSGVEQYLLRPAVGYKLGSKLQGWLGYGRFRTNSNQGHFDEDRFFQQLNWSAGELLGGSVKMRARLLQRSISIADDTALALRFMIAYARPITAGSSTQLLLRIEPWYDFLDTDWNGDAGFTQNRFYAGLGWELNDNLGLETGYMNQYLWRDSAENLSNNLAVINLRVTF